MRREKCQIKLVNLVKTVHEESGRHVRGLFDVFRFRDGVLPNGGQDKHRVPDVSSDINELFVAMQPRTPFNVIGTSVEPEQVEHDDTASGERRDDGNMPFLSDVVRTRDGRYRLLYDSTTDVERRCDVLRGIATETFERYRSASGRYISDVLVPDGPEDFSRVVQELQYQL